MRRKVYAIALFGFNVFERVILYPHDVEVEEYEIVELESDTVIAVEDDNEEPEDKRIGFRA